MPMCQKLLHMHKIKQSAIITYLSNSTKVGVILRLRQTEMRPKLAIFRLSQTEIYTSKSLFSVCVSVCDRRT